MKKIGVGIYGENAHQVHGLLEGHPDGVLVAAAAFPEEKLPRGDEPITRHPTLEALLADPRVDLVSICSPRRAGQGREIVAALRAGKHVYAEKPCATSEAEIDEIVRVAGETGRRFHEMAGTAFGHPYAAMREAIAAGTIGEVVQVAVGKSYPYHAGRPQDEDVDGGLVAQSGIHALRLIEHVAGVRIASVSALETGAANPVPGGGLRMAAVLTAVFVNGGLASATANYLNPRGTGVWGDDSLRVWGTLGLVESARGGETTRLVVGGEDRGPLPTTPPPAYGDPYLDLYLRSLRAGAPMPLSLDDELSPTRWVLRARDSARQAALALSPCAA